jgi:hypothetical protein
MEGAGGESHEAPLRFLELHAEPHPRRCHQERREF